MEATKQQWIQKFLLMSHLQNYAGHFSKEWEKHPIRKKSGEKSKAQNIHLGNL